MIPGLKTGRDHHLLSDLEFRFFLLAEFSDTITDIREQFPLFSREEVVHLASSLHIKHPKYPGTSIPAVLSTDFVLTGPSVPHGVMARSIKYSDDLSNSRVLAKLQLEERYWAHRGIDWRLVTERDIPATLFKNVQWLRRGAGEDFSAPLLDALVTALLSQRKSRDLGGAIRSAGKAVGLSEAQAFLAFQKAIWNRHARIDLGQPISLSKPLSDLHLAADQDEETSCAQRSPAKKACDRKG